ncbi:MAG: hypothetical protein K0B07_05790 [DPANN group archaeon]|nr:hypothetical protein [DPANN group archaeon]
MKNIIFLFLILNSFVFSYDSPNPATDKLTLTGTTLNTCKSIDYPINTYFYEDSNHATCLKFTSTIYTSTLCPDGKKYNKYSYAVYIDYPSCPSGQEIINGSCAVPPTCATGTLWNPITDTCEYDPNTADADGDGIPDKCDPDYVDYLTMDCNSDGEANGVDDDIDGDGIKNANDTNPFVAGTGDLDLTCKGANIGGTSSLPFPFSTYSFISNDDTYKCGLLLLNSSVYDAVVSLNDINNPACENSYCYAHKIKNECDFDVSFYRPSTNWDYIPYKTESQCDLLVDGIRYSSSSYSVPDSQKCPSTSFCFVKRIDEEEDVLPTETNSENQDPTMEAPDLNSTTSDLSPLLNAQNTSNKHLQDLKDKTDYSNKRLDDLKDLSSKSLDVNKDMKSTLNSLKSNSDRSLENQSNSLSKLSSLDSNLKKMSDTTTSNQVIANGSLSSIDGKMTTNNSLLTDIKDSFLGDDPFPAEVDDGLTSNLSGIDSNVKGAFSGFVYSNMFSFANQTYTIPTISFSSSLGSFTVLDSSMLAGLDINAIRAMFLFFFAVAGFITVFKTI